MQLARRLLLALHRGQQGQAVMWMIGLTVVALMTGAIAVDLGVWLRDLRFAQNKADAVVLAAVLELPEPGESSARQVAEAWFQQNIPADMLDRATLDCCTFEDRDGDGRSDTVRARVSLRSHSLFARLLGFGDPTVSKPAGAMRVRARGATVMPWAVFCQNPRSDTCGLNANSFFPFHLGTTLTPGNFDALAVDGGGASDYRNAITGAGGSSGVVFDGQNVELMSKTGSMGQNTCDALYTRVTSPPFNEQGVPRCGRSGNQTTPFCDASSPNDARNKAQDSRCQGRVVVIPITENFEGGGKDKHVKVYMLGTFYIAGWARQAPWEADKDGDGKTEMVWGYWLPDVAMQDPWKLVVEPDNPGSGELAPLVAVLIE